MTEHSCETYGFSTTEILQCVRGKGDCVTCVVVGLAPIDGSRFGFDTPFKSYFDEVNWERRLSRLLLQGESWRC